jgi:hypothetical protein
MKLILASLVTISRARSRVTMRPAYRRALVVAYLCLIGALTAATASGAASPARVADLRAAPFSALCDGVRDDTPAFNAAILYAAAHPDSTVLGRAGQPQGVVHLAYSAMGRNTCRIYRVRLLSNVRLVIDRGVTIEQYGSGRGYLLSLGGSTNASILGGDLAPGVSTDHWVVDVDAAQTGGNRDIHPIQIGNGEYAEIEGPSFLANWSQPLTPPASAKFKTTSAMIHYGDGSNHVWLENASARHVPAGYGLTEVNAGGDLYFSDISSQGGVALRLETNPSKSTEGIDTVEATGVSGSRGLEAINLSAHSLSILNVVVNGVTARGEGRGVHITNAAGFADPGGGTVTASISSGCVYAGRRAQIRTGDDMWRVGRSVTVADAVGVDPSRLQFTIDGVGAAGTFADGPGPYVDPSVRC